MTRNLALIWCGGTLGTALRAGLGLVVPVGWIAWPTLIANVTGAFALGALYAALDRAGTAGHARPRLRLFLGTGVLGGFTTYSALAVATASHGWPGIAYGLVTLVAGLLACALGASAAGHPRAPRPGRAL